MTTLLFGLLSLITAFIFEGISHGLRTANERTFSLYWHSANVIFIALFSLSMWLGYKVLIINETPLHALLIVSTYIILSRWCVFNYLYNAVRKKSIFYLSARGLDSLYIIYIERIFPREMVLISKIFALITMITLILIY